MDPDATWTDAEPASTGVFRWAAAVMALLVGGYFLLPLGATAQLAYLAICASAGVLIVAGIRIHRPAYARYWYGFALGYVFLTAGNALWTYYDLVLRTSPYPSPADLLYLVQSATFCIVLWLVTCKRIGGRDWPSALDATIISVGAGVLAWVFVIERFTDPAGLPTVQRILAVAYPMTDVLVAALVVRLLLAPTGRRNVALMLLVAGALMGVTVNVTFVVLEARGSYYFGHPLDALWLLQFGLTGLAALHPSMRELATPAGRAPGRLSSLRMSSLVLAAIAAPSVTVFKVTTDDSSGLLLTGPASVLIFLLVLVRMIGVVRREEQSLRQLQSVQAQRGLLLQQSVWSTEEERRRVAVDLHDGPIRRLAASALDLGLLDLHLEHGRRDAALALVRPIARALRDEIEQLRRIMTGLRPPLLDERGLANALHQLAGGLREDGVATQVDIHLDRAIEPALEMVLYRVVQEAFTNIGKHAAARTARLVLQEVDGQVRLTVADDGCGFEPGGSRAAAAGHHAGLAIMRERVELSGGQWILRSLVGGGTLIEASMPLDLAALPT